MVERAINRSRRRGRLRRGASRRWECRRCLRKVWGGKGGRRKGCGEVKTRRSLPCLGSDGGTEDAR